MSTPVVLISGVSHRVGIGAGIARKLAAEGWDLALTYWQPYDSRMPWGEQPDDVTMLENQLVALGARVQCIPGDLEMPDTASAIFKASNKALGPVTALVMAHCESVDSGILNTTVESFDRHFAVNARARQRLRNQPNSEYQPHCTMITFSSAMSESQGAESDRGPS